VFIPDKEETGENDSLSLGQGVERDTFGDEHYYSIPYTSILPTPPLEQLSPTHTLSERRDLPKYHISA